MLAIQQQQFDLSNLSSSRLKLRPLDRSDLPLTLQWRNQEHVRSKFVSTAIIEPSSHEQWFEGYLNRDDDLLFVVETISAPLRPIGQVGLYSINHDSRSCEIGRVIIGERANERQGYASEAYGILIAFAREQMHLREIRAVVREGNTASMALHTKFGFKETNKQDGFIHFHLEL
jgi:RimJ/RimL family protein N-acetyltransferase